MALSSQGKKDLKKELDKRNNLESYQREFEAIDNRNECRNIVKLQQQQQRKEQETADQEQNAREGEAYQGRILEQEETLSREKERQMLRENRNELKELETELRDVHKESDLRVQMAENEEKRLQEGFWSVKSNTTLEGARAKKSEHKKQQELDEKHEHRKELQDQMRHNKNLMSGKYEDFLREKILIDQVVERIHQEDQRDLQEKWLEMQKTKEEIMAFKEAHEVWKEKQREQIEEENRKIQEHMFSEHSDDQADAVKKQGAQLRKEMVDTIAKRLGEKRELLEQQLIEYADLLEYKDIERHFRQRINMNSGLDNQAKECKEKQVAKEESHHREMVQRNADEGLKLEFMSKDKCRIRTVQLRKDLEDLVLEERMHQAERKRKIEDERIRMLRERAVRHIGYMPSGIFMEEKIY